MNNSEKKKEHLSDEKIIRILRNNLNEETDAEIRLDKDGELKILLVRRKRVFA